MVIQAQAPADNIPGKLPLHLRDRDCRPEENCRDYFRSSGNLSGDCDLDRGAREAA
jgi:hypothetical protein